jgi:hypothetical protein
MFFPYYKVAIYTELRVMRVVLRNLERIMEFGNQSVEV